MHFAENTQHASHGSPADSNARPNHRRALSGPGKTFVLAVCFLAIGSILRAARPSFVADFRPVIENNRGFASPVSSLAPIAGGGFIAVGPFTRVGTAPRNGFARLGADLTPVDARVDVGDVQSVAVDAQGRIYVIADTRYGSTALRRLKSDGVVDTSFAYQGPARAIVGIQSSGNLVVTDQNGFQIVSSAGAIVASVAGCVPHALLADGGIVVAEFTPDGQTLGKRRADGSADLSFAPGAFGSGGALRIRETTSGKLYVGTTEPATYAGVAVGSFFRLNADGTVDATFKPDAARLAAAVSNFVPHSDDSVTVFDAYPAADRQSQFYPVRFTAAGAIDGTFAPAWAVDLRPTVLLPDGARIVAAGAFQHTDGTIFRGIVRLGRTGARDGAAQPFGTPGQVHDVLPLANGAVLVAGEFTHVNGQPAPALARLKSDGTLDTGFNPGVSFTELNTVAIDSRGRVVVGGPTVSDGGAALPGSLVRLRADGAVDTTFRHSLDDLHVTREVLVDKDDKVTVVGGFSSAGTSSRICVRLNPDGTLDSTFNATAAMRSPSDTPQWAFLDAQGRVLIGGDFAAEPGLIGSSGVGVMRLLPSGAIDPAFTMTGGVSGSHLSNTVVASGDAATDGYAVVGGTFTGIGGVRRPHLARLGANGAVDTGFAADAQPNDEVSHVSALRSGRVLVTGLFTRLGDRPAAGLGVLDAKGRVDATLDVSDSRISTMAAREMEDGSVLLYGRFTRFAGTDASALVRVRFDTPQQSPTAPGSPSPTPNPPTSPAAPGTPTTPATGTPVDSPNPAQPTTPGAPATPGAPSQVAGLTNMSVRTRLQPGVAFIAGFNAGSDAKPVLMRVAGPSLAPIGIQGASRDVKLRVYQNGAVKAENDDWSSDLQAVFTTVGAFPFDRVSKDSAVLLNASDSVSALVEGQGGIALVELYDAKHPLDPGAPLRNVSARTHVGTGDAVLIAGFHVAGSGVKRVLIRAVGPSLAAYGVAQPLANPRLEVFNHAGTKIAESDDWASELAATFESVGAFPLPTGSKDAAVVVSLAANANYTAQVSGVADTIGEALVEVYDIQ